MTVYVVFTHDNRFIGVFATRAEALAVAEGRHLIDEVTL